MAAPIWQKVHRDLGHGPIIEGPIGGANLLYVERYIFQSSRAGMAAMATRNFKPKRFIVVAGVEMNNFGLSGW